MNDNVHPLIQHTPADAGNVSIPALRVLSEITTSLSTDANVEQLISKVVSVDHFHRDRSYLGKFITLASLAPKKYTLKPVSIEDRTQPNAFQNFRKTKELSLEKRGWNPLSTPSVDHIPVIRQPFVQEPQ